MPRRPPTTHAICCWHSRARHFSANEEKMTMTPRPVMFVVSGLLAAGLLQVNVGGQGGGQTAGPAPGESLSQSYRGSQSNNVEYQKIAPFKVFDNLYYVGPGSVAVWLIPTTDGLILIRSEEHTSELQSQSNLVCRLLLEKKKK